MNIAIIIPTYNERENIENIVSQIFSLLPNAMIVVVDDNSPDNTALRVKELQKRNKKLHLIMRKNKGGRGSAVIDGFFYARQNLNPEIYIEMDADLSHDPSELPLLIKKSKVKTIILASRYISGSKIIDVPVYRRLMSKASNFFISFLLGMSVADNTNGYRCYRRDAIDILLKYTFISKGYILLSESAFLLYTRGFLLVEIPSVFRNRRFGVSNATFFEFFHALTSVLRIRTSVLSI